jgi:hypothetical protein
MCPYARPSFVERSDDSRKEDAMKYMLLIHHGDSPEWDALSEDEKKAVPADYQAVNHTSGVTRACGWSRRRRPPPSASRTGRR